MYDSGSISGGGVFAGGLAATGVAAGQWWILVLSIAFVVTGLLIIRFSSRKAIRRVRLANWDDLDDAIGVDPRGLE
ncbi:hypothetical protein WDJ51_05335 [Rathayibacter sp. YIM 133350]|uniref:hypothetical protein n=1 Tax=Rathayibacter sp. YIM 133350 TaxID=3131992 RepID=UPI00307F08F6